LQCCCRHALAAAVAAGTLEGVSFQPKDVPIGPVRLQLNSGELIEGLETALIGMKQGGKRRVLVPPEVGYVSK
jgi:FKBP-type peptidyl-prolyl cis-trans isomerase